MPRWGIAMRRMFLGLFFTVGLFACANARAATTYTVSTLADTAGTCSGISCTTLRAAITAANASAGNGNTINLTGLSGTITLTSALPVITQSIAIAGPGASTLTISGNILYPILRVNISSAPVAISGLTLANANNSGGLGGAIYSGGPLTVTNSTFSGNSANLGGAIYGVGTLTVTNSTFSGNSADGGAIYASGSALVVTNSTFSGNSSTAFGGGGAIAVYSNGNPITAMVINSTFTGNNGMGGEGGAIFSQVDTLTAYNNIFTGNSALLGASIEQAGGHVNATNNLYYRNEDKGGFEDDCNYCTTNANAITGSNPNLLPLGFYGGPTQTLLPQSGSPAICAGSFADVPSGTTTDQRGFALSSSACSNGGVDVGAVQTGYFQVTTTADSGPGSLRAAINAVNETNSGGDINFAVGATGTITLASSLPTIAQDTSIIGPGADKLTISGNHAYQILNVSSGALTIFGLNLANGTAATGNGGAVENSGTLNVIDSAFSGNFALDYGGAISSSGASTLIDSTFSGNTATSNGGAVSSTGTLTVTNSTFTGNSGGYEAAGGAGGIYNTGALTVTNSTFSGNSGNYGGAIYNYGSAVTAYSNILTGNVSQYGQGAGILDDSGTVNAAYNLYYQNLDAGTTEDDCDKCATNSNAVTGSDPLITVLGSYGGATQTMLPRPGSAAICAGSPALIPNGLATDQRGFDRTIVYNAVNCLDLGAVQTNYTAVAFSSPSYTEVATVDVSPAPIVTVTENGQNIGGIPITLTYSGSGTPVGLGPVTTVGGAGATFSGLNAPSPSLGTLTASLPITASTTLSASAQLRINPDTQVITFAAPSPLTYGTAPITLTATGGASGNPVVFTLDASSTPGAATLSGSTLTIKGAGTVVIDANQAASVDYAAAAQVQQSILVNPASITITASSPTVIYGSAVPTITPIFGTFFDGDTSAVLTQQPTCATTYTTTSAVGSLPTTSCSGALAANYTFTYINGSVTVSSAPTFSIGSGSASISLEPGATMGNTVPIMVTASNGFTGTVNLSCSISPVAATDPPTCSLSPASVTIAGTGAQTATLTISTTVSTVSEYKLKRLFWPSGGTVLALVLVIVVPRRRGWMGMLSALMILIAAGAIGCSSGGSGGGSSSGNPGTAPGTYTITVMGTSGNVTGIASTVALTVQ